MDVRRLLAAIAMSLTSGLCVAGQGLRVHTDDGLWHQDFAAVPGMWADSERVSSDRFFGLSGQQSARLDGHHTESGFGLVTPLPGGWSTSFDFAAGNMEREKPRYNLLAQVGRDIGAGWGLKVGVQHFASAGTDLDLGTVTVERLFGNQRVSYTLFSGRPVERRAALSHRVQWSYQVGDRGFFGLSLAQGLGFESAALEGLPAGDVRNLTLFGRYWFMPNWAFSAAAETQEQVGFARRNGVRFGLQHQF